MAGLNIVISGYPYSGKSALLSALLKLIGEEERVILVEEYPALVVSHDHLVKLRTGNLPQTIDGPVVQSRVIENAMLMRPDRLIVDELTPGAVFSWLQATGGGQTRGITTSAAGSPEELIHQLTFLAMRSEQQPPAEIARELVTRAVDLVVQLEARAGGTYQLTSVVEILESDGDRIGVGQLFHSRKQRSAESGARSYLAASVTSPRIRARLEATGVSLPADPFAG